MHAQFHPCNRFLFVSRVSVAFIDLVISRTFRRVKVLTASNNFLRRLRDRHLSLTAETISSRTHPLFRTPVVSPAGISVRQGAC